MVSLVNINNDIKEPTGGYSTSKILTFDGYVKVKESLDTRVINWVKTILNHIATNTILLNYEGPCMIYIYTHPQMVLKKHYQILVPYHYQKM